MDKERLQYPALFICGEDGQQAGIITDREEMRKAIIGQFGDCFTDEMMQAIHDHDYGQDHYRETVGEAAWLEVRSYVYPLEKDSE